MRPKKKYVRPRNTWTENVRWTRRVLPPGEWLVKLSMRRTPYEG